MFFSLFCFSFPEINFKSSYIGGHPVVASLLGWTPANLQKIYKQGASVVLQRQSRARSNKEHLLELCEFEAEVELSLSVLIELERD